MAEAKTGAKSAPPKTVDEYMVTLPEGARAMLEELRQTIKAAAPGATEVISYGMPTFKYQKAFVYYSAWKSHYAMYGISSAALDAHREAVKPYVTEKGALKFPYGETLPTALVTKLVKAQIAENEASAAR